MVDISQFVTDSFLADYTDKPIEIIIKDLSNKYNIKIIIQAFKKPKE